MVIHMRLIEIFPKRGQHPNLSDLYPLHSIKIFQEAVNKSTTYGTTLHIVFCINKCLSAVTIIKK